MTTDSQPRFIDCCIVRIARRKWTCRGDGAVPPYTQFAPACQQTIHAGDRYLEYVGESPAYQSGTRHCWACALAFYGEQTR
jgi:hypothetical protein